MTHGSGGKRRYHDKYIDLLTDLGLVVFQLDHYAARKIKYDKTFSKVSGLTFMNDAYAALNILKTNKKIKYDAVVMTHGSGGKRRYHD